MKVNLKNALFTLSLLASALPYWISSSYGMHIEDEGEDGRGKKTLKTSNIVSITSFSALEHKLKRKNNPGQMESELRKVAYSLRFEELQKLVRQEVDKLIQPFEQPPQKDHVTTLWGKAAKQGNFAGLYNMGWLSQALGDTGFYIKALHALHNKKNKVLEIHEVFYWRCSAYLQNPTSCFIWFIRGVLCLTEELEKEKNFVEAIKEFAVVGRGWMPSMAHIAIPTGGGNVVQIEVPMRLVYAIEYAGEENYSTAIQILQKAADQNNSWAQIGMGLFYATGSGGEQDYIEAMKWFRKAAHQNNSWAQIAVGVLQKDDTEALKWFHKAADQNNSTAQYEIGRRYKFGEGVEKDCKKALEWWQKAPLMMQVTTFDSCELTDTDASQLGSLLSQTKHLSQICLFGNKFTSQGLKELLKGLSSHPSLSVLSLVNNFIDDEGGKELLTFLKNKRSLKQLYITGNPMSTEMQKLIEEAVKKNNT